MTNTLTFRAWPNSLDTNHAAVLMAIPKGWVITGSLALPADASFGNKKILASGGYRFSRHFPFPLAVSRATSQRERDDDISKLLESSGDYVPRFEEWDQYGINPPYSSHWTKVRLGDLYRNGYVGQIRADLHVNGDLSSEITARCAFALTQKKYGPEPPTAAIQFPSGGEELIEPIRSACQREGWKELVVAPT